MGHGYKIAGCSEFTQFQTPSFSTDFDIGHGIKTQFLGGILYLLACMVVVPLNSGFMCRSRTTLARDMPPVVMLEKAATASRPQPQRAEVRRDTGGSTGQQSRRRNCDIRLGFLPEVRRERAGAMGALAVLFPVMYLSGSPKSSKRNQF